MFGPKPDKNKIPMTDRTTYQAFETRWSTNQGVRNLVDLWYPHLRSHNTNTRLYNRCTINISGSRARRLVITRSKYVSVRVHCNE